MEKKPPPMPERHTQTEEPEGPPGGDEQTVRETREAGQRSQGGGKADPSEIEREAWRSDPG